MVRSGLFHKVISVAGLAVGLAANAQAQTAENPSVTQETYRDWQVICRVPEGGTAKSCVMSQERVDNGTGQRVMAVELRPAETSGMHATFIMPFGLALQAGVSLQVDDKEPTPAIPFSTCIPVGCVLPVTLDNDVVKILRGANTLNMKIQTLAGEDMTLAFSLSGFTAATDRIAALSK